jgi:hypothetical protein
MNRNAALLCSHTRAGKDNRGSTRGHRPPAPAGSATERRPEARSRTSVLRRLRADQDHGERLPGGKLRPRRYCREGWTDADGQAGFGVPASATMSNAATAHDTPKAPAQTNRTSRWAYPAASAVRQRAAGNARAVIATTLMATLALAGFAATRPLATADVVRVAPTCSDTCAPAQTTMAPAPAADRGSGSDRSLAERSGERRSGTEEVMSLPPAFRSSKASGSNTRRKS